ncbi:hypothetical protein [Paludisphaera mucosa]|uniref:Uncharacterized protein n=1 Tax=Paludisphaera mucosa TaxID=3030827 RepID=A0ABT6FJG9_9BACT|nr:hypothetical protein [Paludisphaera mucosa]MDG3007697.1 hypothetical protein [Paludisphaera mucosa]
MSIQPARTPSYRHHKGTGQAVVTFDGRAVNLGLHGSEASRKAYDRVIAEWLANGRRLPDDSTLTVVESNWPRGITRAPGPATARASR